MGTKTIKGKFLPQYRTAAQWSAADTVLLRGEIGVESDTRKFKYGDGTTSWNNLGYAQGESAGGSSEIIYISDAESISKAVTSVKWNEVGQIIPIIIYDPAGVAGLPADVPSNCSLVGDVQKADDGTISSDDGYVVTLNVFQEDNFLSGIWYQILLNSAGEVLEEKKYSLDNKGLLRDAKYLGTSFWALISSNDTDIQAFVVDENSPEVPAEYKGEGFGFARHYWDDVGMATVTIKLNAGSVKTFNVTFYGDGSEANWEEVGGNGSASALTDAVVITGTIKDFDFGFEKAGDMKPLKIARTAVGLPDTSFDFYGWAQCQYRESATQYNVNLYIIQATTSKPRIFTAMYAKGYTPSWVELGKEPETGWLYEGDQALSNNVKRSFYLRGYSKKTGDRLQIEFAYLGGGTEGHIMGFNQGQTIIYNPAETLTTSFWTLVTNSGNAQQYEVLCTFRMSGQYLYIKAVNQNSGSVNVAAQFRIKGIRVLRK